MYSVISLKARRMAMHAKCTPQTLHPLPRIASPGLRRDKKEYFGAGNLFAPISPLLICWSDYTLPLESMVAVLSVAIRCV